MTRRRSSPLGLELVLSVVLALVVLPLLSHGAPVQESHADLQRYSEGCYYNYNHYSEGDRILTNEPCLNCTCHNKMLMCYLRVCPFTKPIGHDCTVEKREDQCCPIVTCPEVPVDIAHHSHQLTTSAPGTELSIPEKYGCSIDNKFYVEGAQVPSNPNKPCELCYCIRNRTACLMQECTLHIDGCQPIYNKGSCCPVRYNCDHENELLEIEDFSTTTTTVRPTQGYLLTSTTSPTVTTDCVHNSEVYADGASITGKNSCEHCYCMRGDIVCAVQECEMPTLESGAKTCRALPPAAGECCPSNYVCDDDSVTTEEGLAEDMLTTTAPIIQGNLHESVSQEDVQLQEHIDDKIPVTEVPTESVEQAGGQKDEITPTTILPIADEVSQPTEEEVKDSEVEEEKPLPTTISAIKETGFETTQSPIEHSTTHKTEEGFEPSHKDKEDESMHPPKEDEIITEEEDTAHATTTVSPVVGGIKIAENEEDEMLATKIPESSPEEETTIHSVGEEDFKKEEVPSKEKDVNPEQVEGISNPEEAVEKDDVSTASSVEIKKPEADPENVSSTTLAPVEKSEDMVTISATETSESETPVTSVPTTEQIASEEILPGKAEKEHETSTLLPIEISSPELESENVSSSTLAPIVEFEGVNKTPATEVSPSSESPVLVTSVPSKPYIEPGETSSESSEFSEESTAGQGESEDKIDENISEPSDSSTNSPIYETITESDNIHIGMPEFGDHKTESDLPKKKPKDEPESIEATPTPSDVTKDEIPQVAIDSTTVHTVDTSTPIPSVDGADEFNELSTTKPSVSKDGETSDQSTQGSIEEKPVQEEIEIPATVEEITEDSSKPVSEEILDENDTPPQTTPLPISDENTDRVSEDQEKEEELSTESSGTEKPTTTSRPVRIHIADEEELSETTTKGTVNEFADSTTSEPSIGDSGAAVTDRKEEEEDTEVSTDDTSSVPSVVDSEQPDAGEVQIEGEQNTTMKAPSALDGAVSSTEEGKVKPEKETEILTGASSTPTPSKTSEPEGESATFIPLDLEETSAGEGEIKGKPQIDTEDSTTAHPLIEGESATFIPLDLEETSAGEGEIKGKPQIDTEDSTTSHPLIDDLEEQHNEEEQQKVQSEHDNYSTSIPTIVDSELAIGEEVGTKEKPEQSLTDLTTKDPSIPDSEETSTEEDVVKPQYDPTKAPAVVDYETTSIVGVSGQQDPELVVDSTITPPKSKPEASSNEDVEKESDIDTSGSTTTIKPKFVDSVIPTVEEDVHKPQQHAIPDATTGYPLPEEEKTTDEELSIDDETTLRNEIEKQSEEGSFDSTTTPATIHDEAESSEEKHKEQKTPASEENITQQPSEQGISDSTNVVPSVDVSDEEVKEEGENALVDKTTVSPFTSDSEGSIEEEIKKQPEQVLVDSSTKTPIATLTETSTTSDQEEKVQQTTTRPSLADSESSISEEGEEKDKDYESSEDGSSTGTPSLTDSDTLSQTTDASPSPVSEEKQDIPTTGIPQTIESEQPSTEADQNKQPIDKEEDIQTNLPPVAHSDKEATGTSEDSEIPMIDIIPSAIPGEGDCLANGKTFANNATVPISSECELSCTCISSIIVCKKKQCIEPPKTNNCILDESSTDKCCPQYICETDSSTEDQRPTTPEEVQDGEIQLTTLAPSHHISTESATSTQKLEDDKPISEDESSKTEIPVFSDENTTPLSMDFEQPAFTPEDPMSHVKADEVQEASTEHSDENIFVEGSTTAQAITIKPTEKVTGDIEQPVEVTSVVPEYSIPSKKPEVITTLGATDDEEEEKATTPSYEELPSTPVIVSEPEKAIVPGEEISTEGTLENEITTHQPIKSVASSEAPSVPSVTQTDDSIQSEEISETSDETSNESGEETDSEEDTKSPLLHKEEDQQITTSRPLVSEHVGDIEPVDESTSIPEMDYAKPAMPEDLSHTKVEDETSLEKEKPSKPIKSVDLETNQESDESIEKLITTPASTILKPVELVEDDIQKVSISDKKDDIPSSESEEEKPHEHKPISSTITPVKTEEEPDSENITESKKGEIETHTSSSIPVSEEESGLEKDQTPSQTIAPVYDEAKPIAVTTIPEKEKDSSEHIAPTTSAPAVEEHSIEGSGANISKEDSEDDKHDVVSSTSTPTIDRTLAPVSSHESSEEKDEISSHTSAPALDGHIPTEQNEYDIKNAETSSQTTYPTLEEQSIEGSGAPTSEEKPDVDQGENVGQTNVPAIHKQPPTSDFEQENEIGITTSPAVEEHTVEGSGESTLVDKSEQDEIISQTSAPAFDKQPSTSGLEDEIKTDTSTSPTVGEHSVEGSGAPVSEDKTDVEEDENASQSTTPRIEKQPSVSDLEEENKIDVTSSPVVGDESVAPVSEDKTEFELDDIIVQTSTPAVERQPPASDIEEDHQIYLTTAPSVEDQTDEESDVLSLGDKSEQDETISQTSAPAFDKKPSTPDIEEDHKIDSTTSPAVEVHTDEGSGVLTLGDKSEQDEIISPTSAPAFPEEHSVEGSGAPISTDVEEDEIASQTTEPTISDLEAGSKIDITPTPAVEEGTSAPVSEDKPDNEQDEIAIQTSTAAIDKKPSTSDLEDENKFDADTLPGGEEHSVEGSGSASPEEDIAHKEQTDTQTGNPISEDELTRVTAAPVSEHDVHSVTPSIENTIAPVLETESEEDIANQTNAPSINVPSSEEESDEEKTSIKGQTPVPSHDLNDKITPQIPSYQTTEKESIDSTSSSEEGEDIVSGTVVPVVGDKYEETELHEDKKPAVLVPISGDEKELELTTISTDVKDENLDVSEASSPGSIPTKDMETSDESTDATDAPAKDTSSMVSGDEYLGATESSPIPTPAKTIDENIGGSEAPPKDTTSMVSDDELVGYTESSAISTPVKTSDKEAESIEGDKTSSTIIPIRAVDIEGEILGSTELPSSSSSAKPIKNVDEDLDATHPPQVDFDEEQTSEEASTAKSESASRVTVAPSKLDDEVFSQTQAPVSSDSNASEADVAVLQTEEQSSDENQNIDKTLLTTESSIPASETVSPSFGTDIDDSESEDKLDQIPTDKLSTQTKQPELMGEETSTKAKDDSESTNVTVMPDIISGHEIVSQTDKPESYDQILTSDIATDKPSADVIPAQNESSNDDKKPSLEESQTTTHTPAGFEQPETPESVEEESVEDTDSKTPQPTGQTEIPASVSSEQDVSTEDAKPDDVDKITTGKPIDNAASTESQEENVDSKPTTSKPAEDAASTQSEEQNDVQVSSTVIPVDQQPITSTPVDVHADSDHTYSTEKSDEEKEHTETPSDGTKIQTIGEFVTDRTDDTTNEDKETISEQPISPELPETVTSLTEEQEKEKVKPEVSVTTDSILPNISSEESNEKTQAPEVSTEVAAEDTKPQEQPTSSTEESGNKTEVPEVTPEISQPSETGSVDESEEKTQSPEITEEDHKQHVQPTEGAIISSTSDKPIVPTIDDDKIASDLPKPIATDEQPSSSEDETPLSTTIHPLFPHIEHNRTTSKPQLNATDKIDHTIPESSSPSIPTTEQSTSQAITNAPTTHYQPPGYGQVPPQYPSYTEDEYTDEDETEVFGPGTCRYGGKLFVSAQQIPRDDPCDFCFCFRSDIICLQQSCPPPISGCHEEPISGFCCPRYECPVSMATTLNITTSTTTTSTTLPPHFLHHAYRGAAAKNGCHISGKSYKVGDKIDSASGPCMHCTCGGDGQMKCDPKTCSPEPMLRQMIAVVASRRR